MAESAVRDLEEIVSYYDNGGVPDVGADLVARILERIETLADHPDVGRIVPEFESSDRNDCAEAGRPDGSLVRHRCTSATRSEDKSGRLSESGWGSSTSSELMRAARLSPSTAMWPASIS